jgi:superfamily II DNA or RNA helicase
LTLERGIIQATVRGSDLYTVRIEPDGSLIRVACTCPYFFDRSDICKHIWAVILAAEARSLPLVPPGTRADAVELEPLDPDEDRDVAGLDEDPDDDWHLDEEVTARPLSSAKRASIAARMKRYWAERRRAQGRQVPQAPIVPPAPPRPQQSRQPATPPPWRQMLDMISGTTLPEPSLRPRLAAGQLLYVIDVAASTKSDAVVVELMTRDRKMNGEWGKPKPARLTAADVRSHPDADERQVLERLLGPRPHLEWGGGWGGYGSDLSRIRLPGVVGADIVPQLCATGRCMLRMSAGAVNGSKAAPVGVTPQTTERYWQRAPAPAPQPSSLTPITWDEGPSWIFTAMIRAADAAYVIEGWLTRGDERMALSDPVLILAEGILFTQTQAARVDTGGAFSWLAALRRAGGIAVPAGARDELIDALLAASPHLAGVPDDLRVETIQGQPRPRLMLRPMSHRPDRVRTELAFDYEGTIVPFESPPTILRSPGSTRAIRRDAEFEKRALDLLHQRGCRHDWGQDTGARVLQLPSSLLPRVVRQLLEKGWHVEAEGRLYRRPGPATLALRSGIDWFELHGSVEYDNQHASLPALLAAVNRGETFVTLDDGTIGLLPEEWLRVHGTLVRLGSKSGDHLRFTKSQVPLLDALIAAQPQTSWDDTFARARADLQAFDGIGPVDPPSTFTGTLRGYQREGLGWLMFLQRFGFGGCLADDMGLGKTVMVLALLAARRAARAVDDRSPALVVAPRSVVFNWRQEAARFTPGLRVLEYVGSGRAAMRASFAEHDVILTTYGTLRRDAEALSAERFDYVVLDEAQAIKNAASVSAKTTRVLQARHRLALSGTPIENHLGELWSLFEFLNPGLLGSAVAFNRTATGERLDDETLAWLARGLRPFILRRTKEQVASDLPPKTEQTLYCELERPQRALYDELRTHYRRTLLEGTGTNGIGRAKLQVLEALLRLRQAACHPGLIDRRRTTDASAKLDVLVPRIVETIEEGHKTLVFSQFTSLLAILRARLDENRTAYEYLDGRTRDRQSKVERFQTDPACRLFLISLKAGGLGLNLTAAEYVFLLDPWWNPAVEAQAIDRAHRIGQGRHVFAYRLIARDTVEERVLELQQRKRRLADAILTADNSLLRDLRREDLELLLS